MIKYKTISCRLTLEEHKKIMQICKDKELTPSEYIKSKIIEQ